MRGEGAVCVSPGWELLPCWLAHGGSGTEQGCEIWLMQTCSHPHPFHLEDVAMQGCPCCTQNMAEVVTILCGWGVAPASYFPPTNP